MHARLRNLRLATLNVWNRSGPHERRERRIVEEIARLQPDVIGLQEIVEEGANQARELARVDGYHVVYCPAGAFGAGTWGNAILSRHPIERSEARALPHGDGPLSRIVVRADVRLPEGVLHFFCTHLSYRADESWKREDQVVAVDAFVREASHELPRVLVGDFNADPDATEIRFLTGKATIGGRSTFYQDAAAIARRPEPTWAERNPNTEVFHEGDRRIDYVFITHARRDGSGSVADCRLAFDEPDADGVYASDHFGVVAELRVGRRAPS